MSTILAAANLGFGRSAHAHQRDVDRMRTEGAVIIATQEDNRGRHRERVTTHRSVQTDGRGAILAAPSVRGYRIRLRRFPWVDCDLPGVGMVRVISVHMPPRRMPGLVPIYGFRLRRLIRRTPHPCLPGGDWNRFLRNDPARLKATFGGRWVGDGIDGWFVPLELVPCVVRAWELHRPKRNDGHPFVFVELTAPGRNPRRTR